MPDSSTTQLDPLLKTAVAKAPTVLEPKAADAQRQRALLPSEVASQLAARMPQLWTPGSQAIFPAATLWTRYRVRLLTGDGAPLAQERCVLLNGSERSEQTTDDKGLVTFTVAAQPAGLAAHLGDGLLDAPRGPLLVLPDILEEFVDLHLPPHDDVLELKRNLAPDSRCQTGDRSFHPVFALTTDVMEIRVNALTPQQKFEYFRWTYISNDAIYVTTDKGDFAKPKERTRWEWSRGASCNQHVNFFLGYWFNYNRAFFASGKNTATAYLPMLDCGKGRFTFNGEPQYHRGYAELVEPVTDFHANTHYAIYSGKTFPGRDQILGPVAKPDGTPYGGNFNVRPEEYARYIRLSQFIDYDTLRLNAEGERFVDALADFNMYSVSEYYSGNPQEQATMQAEGLGKTRKWLKANKSLDHLQVYSVKRGKERVPLAAATDPEIDALSDALLWQIMWKLDDAEAQDAALLSDLRESLNADHHAGILVKRAVGGGPLTGSGPVELWKFSADGGTRKNPNPPIVMKRFLGSVAYRGCEPLFTHYAIWKLKPLRDGGFAPADAAIRAAVAGKIDLDAPPRFIHWAALRAAAATSTA